MTTSTRCILQKSRGVICSGKKSACGKHIDHGVVGGRARHSHILQVYRHSTSIQYTEYKSRHPNTSPDTQIPPPTQVQTLKNPIYVCPYMSLYVPISGYMFIYVRKCPYMFKYVRICPYGPCVDIY